MTELPNDLNELAILEIEALAKKPPVTVTLNPMTAFLLIAQVQLALRHPQNDGLPSKEMRSFIQGLRRQIAAPGDAIDTLITMGFDSKHDGR